MYRKEAAEFDLKMEGSSCSRYPPTEKREKKTKRNKTKCKQKGCICKTRSLKLQNPSRWCLSSDAPNDKSYQQATSNVRTK